MRVAELTEQDVLGYLDHQLLWPYAMTLKCGGDALDQLGISKLTTREIDSHLECVRAVPGACPSGNLPAGLVEYEVSDRGDESASLGDGYELAGQDHTPVAVTPANERLGAQHRTVCKVDHRLVEHEQFGVVNRTA